MNIANEQPDRKDDAAASDLDRLGEHRDGVLDQAQTLARMAAIAGALTEHSLCLSRATSCDNGIYTLQFGEDALRNIRFAISDVAERAAKLAATARAVADGG